MKWNYIFRAFSVVTFVSNWFTKAMEDGKIDPKEAGELVEGIAKILDIEIEIYDNTKNK